MALDPKKLDKLITTLQADVASLKRRLNELLAKHTRVGVEAPPPSLADVPAFILPEGTQMRIH